ncbi:hypothetical protein K3172_01385 [Qipengyuania sp. 6B39]|uniref:ExbD/TolR family protein n=1 Tax=Qipengyuania proteolytica TaxID=2867239 RepID=UPI001C896FD2|nr:hypothetical protein [Qipengyuania proteolytica]MBX7494504.1 hypothetical protein [Qipengyuania proteolytica]
MPNRSNLWARTRQRTPFNHGEPIRRPDSLPILLFILVLIATMLAMAGRASHALVIDLPAPNLEPETALGLVIDRVAIDAGDRITWNGVSVTPGELERIARDVSYYPGVRRLEFTPAGEASYQTAFAVLGILWRAGLTREGFCFGDLARHRTWGGTRRGSSGRELLPPCLFNMGPHPMPVSTERVPRRGFWSIP